MNEILIRARRGEVAAQDELRRVLRPRLESLAGYYAARTGMDSADLLQEAWVAVFEALPQIDLTIGTPAQYLLKHARWQILDHIRWNKRRSHEALDDLVVETPEVAENSWGTAVNRAPTPTEVEAKLMIDDLKSRLNPKQKEILHGLMDGYTWRQIGDSLGCTSANVAYHVRGIRQAYSAIAN